MPLIQADARAIPLADESVNCVVTSPPYWGLRDYGVPGQIGLERTPEEFVATMVEVFREVRRVLRRDGTCWVNLGDSYIAHLGQRSVHDAAGPKQASNRGSTGAPSRYDPRLKPKDLCMIPARVALALQADGWWLRSDIVWAKPNPMPESVTDRPTKAHEYVFLLTKAERYWYDAEAVREPHTEPERGRAGERRPCVDERPEPGVRSGTMNSIDRGGGGRCYNPFGRNARSVWTIPTQPYPGAHFATFPEALAERCILAGCPERLCAACGAPWVREVEKSRTFESGSGRSGILPSGKHGPGLQGGGETGDIRRGPVVSVVTTGFSPTCECGKTGATRPGIVLDPFVGSGTTVRVARRHGRIGIGLDLSWSYLHDHALARGDGRTSEKAVSDLPMFGGAS